MKFQQWKAFRWILKQWSCLYLFYELGLSRLGFGHPTFRMRGDHSSPLRHRHNDQLGIRIHNGQRTTTRQVSAVYMYVRKRSSLLNVMYNKETGNVTSTTKRSATDVSVTDPRRWNYKELVRITEGVAR